MLIIMLKLVIMLEQWTSTDDNADARIVAGANADADAETDVDADADAQASGSNLLPPREARCLQVGARDVLGRAQLPKAISTGW